MKNCCQNNNFVKAVCDDFSCTSPKVLWINFRLKIHWFCQLPIERIRRIEEQFSKIKYIWLNYQKKNRTKLISKHIFPALKNYHFWTFWKIHD
jgi:hypothetical protein